LAVQAAAPLGTLDDPLAELTFALFSAAEFPDDALKVALRVLESPASSFSNKLIATRVVQLALGDLTDPKEIGTVAEGYSFRKPVSSATAVRIAKMIRPLTYSFTEQFEKRKSTLELDRELARISGGIASAAGKDDAELYYIAAWMSRNLNKDSTVESDIHYLAALGRLHPFTLRDAEAPMAYALLEADKKLLKQRVVPDNNWPRRFEELCAALIPRHNYLTSNLARSPNSIGRPAHLPIIKYLKLTDPEKALLVWNAAQGEDYPWTAGVIQAIAFLPNDTLRPKLLKLWERGGLEDAILPILAKEPQEEDAAKFMVGLRSMNPEVVKLSAAALNKLPPREDKADLVAAILALRRLPDDKTTVNSRSAILSLLKDRSGQSLTDAKAWSEWFATKYPGLAAKLNASDGFDPVAWKKREAAIPWAEGDPIKGRTAFTKATCAACHDGGGAVGPSLSGVAKRFSRDDLLTAILQPSKDVSPRYRPTRLATTDGKAYLGMIVYEAVSGVMLQTGPDAVVRIAGDQIESQKPLDTSLMPASLLDKLND
ncbi:MAG TPA: hypothetical protein VGL71_03285, partial [Urbifossiella sp.]